MVVQPNTATTEVEPRAEPLAFRGGPLASATPIASFILVTLGLIIAGAPVVEGMILGAMIGISLGMTLARDTRAYNERVFSLMANRIATVAIVCWLWAGAFSGILAESGLIEALVWVGGNLELTGAAFTVAVFLTAAFFAVSVGTGLGTVVGFTAVMYPAGIVLGANPAALMGAILSGAAFGDNLAPISDTTIVSAATQETDVGGVVRARVKYVAIAGSLCVLLFLLLGGGAGAVAPNEARRLLADTADPSGLPMLLPAAVVFGVAVLGGHFLVALTAGILVALVVGPLSGIFALDQVFRITADGTIAGSAVSGATAMLPISILTLLLVASIGIMQASGLLDMIVERLEQALGRSRRGIEATIVTLASFANLCVSVNTVAMVTVGPLANTLRKRHGIHPHRSANLLDTISCTFPYVLPYGAAFVTAAAIQRELAGRYDFVVVTSWADEASYFFYGIVLLPLMLLAVLTGYGAREG